MRWLSLVLLALAVLVGAGAYLLCVPLVIAAAPMVALAWKPMRVFGFRVFFAFLLVPWVWHGGHAAAKAVWDRAHGEVHMPVGCFSTNWEDQWDARYVAVQRTLDVVLGPVPPIPPRPRSTKKTLTSFATDPSY